MLTQDFSRRGQALFFYNLKPSVVAVFEGVQPKGFITYYHRHDLDILFQRWRSVFDIFFTYYTSKIYYCVLKLVLFFREQRRQIEHLQTE